MVNCGLRSPYMAFITLCTNTVYTYNIFLEVELHSLSNLNNYYNSDVCDITFAKIDLDTMFS